MSEKFIFQGKTTFIDQPHDTIIQNFQNDYITSDDSENDKINIELKKLVELILNSKDIPTENKEETIQAIHSVAEQVKEQNTNKLTTKAILEAIQNALSKATDIAVPAMTIITTILKLLGLS